MALPTTYVFRAFCSEIPLANEGFYEISKSFLQKMFISQLTEATFLRGTKVASNFFGELIHSFKKFLVLIFL